MSDSYFSAVRKLLSIRAAAARIEINDGTISALEAYYGLLSHWNKRINLTGLSLELPTEPAIDRLLIEPLVAARELLTDETWVDFGSGGGSPAIPMKVIRPESSLTMVESKTKKAAFLREVVRELRLPRATVIEGRFSELRSRADMAESAALITARGVRQDEELFDAASALLRVHGRVALFSSAGSMPLEVPSGFSRPQVVPLFQTTALCLYRRL